MEMTCVKDCVYCYQPVCGPSVVNKILLMATALKFVVGCTRVNKVTTTRLSHSGQKAKWPRGVATELLRWRVPTRVRGQCIFMRQKLEIVFSV